MLSPSFTLSLAQSISEVILAAAMRHTDDTAHIHILLDTLQKIRHSWYHTHGDFATGYMSGQTFYQEHAPACPFTLDGSLLCCATISLITTTRISTPSITFWGVRPSTMPIAWALSLAG